MEEDLIDKLMMEIANHYNVKIGKAVVLGKKCIDKIQAIIDLGLDEHRLGDNNYQTENTEIDEKIFDLMAQLTLEIDLFLKDNNLKID